MSASIATIPLQANPAPNAYAAQSELAKAITARQQALEAQQAVTQAQQQTQAGALKVAQTRYALSYLPGFDQFTAGVPGAPPPINPGGGDSPNAGGALTPLLTQPMQGDAGGAAGGGQPATGGGGAPGGGQAQAVAPGAASRHPWLAGPDMSASLYGIPVPRAQIPGIMQSSNQPGEIKNALATGHQFMSQIMSSLPWEAAIQTAYQAGYLPQQRAGYLADHPELKEQFVQSLASPDALTSLTASALKEHLQPNGRGGFEVSQPAVAAAGATDYAAKQGGLAAESGMPAPASAGGPGGAAAAPPQRASDMVDPNGTISGADYAARVKGTENNTGDPNARSTTSSATGDGQFIDQTWVDVMNRNRPELTAGKSRDQILAMRGQPGLQEQMTEAYAQENAPKLAAANLGVNATTLALAHHFGPGGVQTLLGADPNAPVRKILPASVMTANPDLMSKKVGDVVGAYMSKFGLRPVSFGAQPGGGAAGAGPPSASGAPGTAAAPPATAAAPPPAVAAAPGVAGGAPIAAVPAANIPPPAPVAGGAPVAGLPSKAGVEGQAEAARQAQIAAAAPAIAAGRAQAEAGVKLAVQPLIDKATAQATAPIEVQKQALLGDAKNNDDATEAAADAINGKTQILQMRDAAAKITTGAFGESRAALGNLLQTAFGSAGEAIATHVLGQNPTSAQEFAKFSVLAAGEQANKNSPRGGYKVDALYANALPNLSTRPDAIKFMTNLIAVGDQLRTDSNQLASDSYAKGYQEFNQNPVNGYTPMSTVFGSFNKAYPAAVGIAAAKALSGDPYEVWSKGLTHTDDPATDQVGRVLGLVKRTDPTAQPMHPTGKAFGVAGP
jgi:hypothetical protein